MDAPDTVTEAVAFLRSLGYLDELPVGPRAAEGAVVDYTFRFEGPSDPADEAIVLGVRLRGGNHKRVFVSAFGPNADPAETAMLTTLTG